MKIRMKVISSIIDEFFVQVLVAMLIRWSEACWICFDS